MHGFESHCTTVSGRVFFCPKLKSREGRFNDWIFHGVCSTHWDQGRPGFGVSSVILPTAQCGGASHEISASKTPGRGRQLLVLWPKPVVETVAVKPNKYDTTPTVVG